MKIRKKILLSYILALSITMILALIDNDPIKSTISFVIDVIFLSILIWGIGLFIYGIKLILNKSSH